MNKKNAFSKYSYEHPFWDLVRYYASLGRKKNQQKEFIKHLESSEYDDQSLRKYLSIDQVLAKDLLAYIQYRSEKTKTVFKLFRSEEESIKFCKDNGFSFGVTQTKSKDHHQSSKTLIAAVSGIAETVCYKQKVSVETNPQERCVWLKNNVLHVSARNLDGALPATKDPFVVWEIKEYWGQTKGGSKMSDAVYECHLVGKEIRDFERKVGHKIHHVVFLDGKEQWEARVSDVARFIDLESQGLIDKLIIGSMVESDWAPLLEKIIKISCG